MSACLKSVTLEVASFLTSCSCTHVELELCLQDGRLITQEELQELLAKEEREAQELEVF